MRFLPLLLLVAACAPGPLRVLPSAPLDASTVIDGRADDWDGALRPAPDEAGLRIGLRDDGDALAVALVAGAKWQTRRIAFGGLTVWIDPTGGREPAYGVEFPIGSEPALAVVKTQGGRDPSADARYDRLRTRFAAGLDTLAVRVGEDGRAVYDVGSLDGLETAVRWTDDDLVVEVRIPLRGIDGVTPEVNPGDAVGVGLEMLDVRIQGRRPPGPSSAGPQRAPSGPSPITRWFSVELAD